MKLLLQQISELAIRRNPASFTEEQKRLKWLGSNPVSVGEINAAEVRLGVELPADYVAFLSITNGFFTPLDSTEPTFEQVEKIGYLKNIDSFLVEIWSEGTLSDIGRDLARSIVVGGIADEQYFLLIPPDAANPGWKYWKFASWIPGESPYENLPAYFTEVLDFMKELAG